MDVILHITKRNAWERAQALGSYRADTLESQGFIHCSTPEQVVRVANSLFRWQDDLMLLSIDREEVEAEIRYENLEGGEEVFPHIYGPLNIDAVVSVVDLKPETDGTFVLPKSL
jgi:uncharacterized protein (DUF952 family)